MTSDDPRQAVDMRTAMIAAHEAYLSARAAGFVRGQALYLAACVLCGGPRPPLGTESGA
ncbi:hypothetical protein [Streptomyces sp. NPDC001404]|uniref:hypothetical protein n=1 Tax=Streptomyces sp. NPDC001404 TaxID=3364571 RepID=UPI00368C24AE